MPSQNSIQRKLLITFIVAAGIPIVVLSGSLVSGLYEIEAMIGAITCLIGGTGLGFFFGRSWINQTCAINDALFKLIEGDFEARTHLITNDELGRAANSLNTIGDRMQTLVRSNNGQKEIQVSIEKLVCEMKGIAAGDLTITTEVKADVTGSIADSVNHMTAQLRSIVQQVQSAAREVTSSSTEIRKFSTAMSNDSDVQASRIGDASSQLMNMTESFQTVASMTQESVMVAVEARQTATNGLKAVSDTVDGMQRIRDQVQNTSKRIKRFGESSQEIGEIVQLISDIADRTSILALNASIQAATAGDAGHGFAVVAEEIELLAERSTDATKQISKLIRAIQNETGEVITDMEEATREVVAGSKLAAQAGTTLFEIDSVSDQLVELIQASSTSALQQSENANRIASTMAEISSSTKQSAEKSREATQAVGMLANMVNQLRGSVSKFKVSDTPVTVIPTESNGSVPTKTMVSCPEIDASKQNDVPTKSKYSRSSNRTATSIFKSPTESPSSTIGNERKTLTTQKLENSTNQPAPSGSPKIRESQQSLDKNLLRQIKDTAKLIKQPDAAASSSPNVKEVSPKASVTVAPTNSAEKQ